MADPNVIAKADFENALQKAAEEGNDSIQKRSRKFRIILGQDTSTGGFSENLWLSKLSLFEKYDYL